MKARRHDATAQQKWTQVSHTSSPASFILKPIKQIDYRTLTKMVLHNRNSILVAGNHILFMTDFFFFFAQSSSCMQIFIIHGDCHHGLAS